jgi:hypothetical protein
MGKKGLFVLGPYYGLFQLLQFATYRGKIEIKRKENDHPRRNLRVFFMENEQISSGYNVVRRTLDI